MCKQNLGYSQPCDRRHLLRYQKTQCKACEPEATTLPHCVHHTYVFRSAEHIRMNFSITLESGIQGHLKHIRYPVPTTLRLHTAVHVYARVHTSIYDHVKKKKPCQEKQLRCITGLAPGTKHPSECSKQRRLPGKLQYKSLFCICRGGSGCISEPQWGSSVLGWLVEGETTEGRVGVRVRVYKQGWLAR